MTDAPVSAAAPTETETVLATALGEQTRWATDLLTAPHLTPDEAMTGHFVRAFLDKHPHGFSATLERWRDQGPFTAVSRRLTAHKSWVTLTDPTGRRFTLAVTLDSNGLVRVLHLQPEFVIPELSGWADLEAVLDIPGVAFSILAARLEGDHAVILHERDAERAMPTGSAYKLYLMRALVHALERGEVRWDDEVTVRPELRSLPTGDMQDLPDGTRVSVRETAHKMIAMSDNTAADLVADLLGREAVERAVADSGHHDPALLRPFLSSREVFELGWGDPALREAWATGDEAARRRLLRQVERPLTVRGADLVTPVHHLGLDWHMNAHDVLKVLSALVQDSDRDGSGTVERILTAYPGVAIDRARWPRAVFKGGSCPGVMMFCWLLEDPDGVRHVLVLQQAADDQKLIGDGQLLRGLGGRVIESGLLTAGSRSAPSARSARSER